MTKVHFYITVAGIPVLLSIAITMPTYLIKQQRITHSQAADLASVDPQNGTVSGNVTIVNDPNASGGKYVVFGTANPTPTATPTPAPDVVSMRVRNAFGVFTAWGRSYVRLPGSDDSLWGGGKGPNYEDAYRNLLEHDVPIHLAFPSLGGLNDSITSIKKELDAGKNTRLLIRSIPIPSGKDIESCADGSCDSYLQQWATTFAQWPQSVLGHIVFNPCWEYNGNWWSQCTIDPAGNGTFPATRVTAYKNYYRRMHDIIQGALDSQGKRIQWSLEFDLGYMCHSTGSEITRTENAIVGSYPGDGYVDVFGGSLYHTSGVYNSWNACLQFVSDFANTHHIKTGIGEMSTWYRVGDNDPNKGDNPQFFRDVHTWMVNEASANRLSHVVLFDYDQPLSQTTCSYHATLFFDMTNWKRESYPQINPVMPGKGTQWTNMPNSRAVLIELFKGPIDPLQL